MPRRFAPRNDKGEGRPCPRAHVLPSACHCEPVRTLVWQSASPQKCLASWQLFGQIRYALRICPKYCFPLCATARRTDCPVASLLAMTEGEACHCEQRSCPRAHVLPSACHCEPVRTLVWQSASPQKCLASWQLFGQTRYALRICPKYCFSLCATARRTDCHVASLLAMTEGEACHCEQRSCPRAHVLPSACHCEERGSRPATWQSVSRRNAWQVGSCSGKLVTPYVFAQSIVFHFVLLQGETDCPVAPLLAMTCNNFLRVKDALPEQIRTTSPPQTPAQAGKYFSA